MTRLNRQEWLNQSLHMLADVGATGLTIDALTNRLNVTKGSFYHHFKNYQEFKIALLEFFEEVGTHNVIRITEAGATPEEKLQRLLETSTGYPPNLEVQIRAWALQDDDVRQFQERIDRERVAYVKALYFAMTHDETQSQVMAELLYTLYVGGQQMLPPIREARLAKLYYALQEMFQRSRS